MADEKPRIAPPPSVDDVLSALTDPSRIGQVDFTAALAPEPPARRTARGGRQPDAKPPLRRVPEPVPAPITEPVPAPITEPEPRDAGPAAEADPAEVEPVAQPEPADAPAAETTPDAEPEAEPTADRAAAAGPADDEQAPEDQAPEPAPAERPRKPKVKKSPAPKQSLVAVEEPTARPEPLLEPREQPHREPAPDPVGSVDVARAVEEIAQGVISRIRTAEEALLRHLEATELEATRRYELVTAQAELDAELIRLQSRREAHAIVTAARMRSGDLDDVDDPGDVGHRLAVLSDAISRVADTAEATLNRSRTRETGS